MTCDRPIPRFGRGIGSTDLPQEGDPAALCEDSLLGRSVHKKGSLLEILHQVSWNKRVTRMHTSGPVFA